jgi:cytoskeletal protein RodZ
MKNKNSDGLLLIIIAIVVGFGIKLCTNKKESANTHTPTNFSDTVTTIKDTTLSNKSILSKKTKKTKKKKKSQTTETVSTNSYSTPITTTKRKTQSYSSSSSSSECPSRQCYASTKKGGRCRNMTKSCNGYCWRHGG